MALWMAFEVADFVVRDFQRALGHVEDITAALLRQRGDGYAEEMDDDIVVDLPPWFQLDGWFARGLLLLLDSPFGRNDCSVTLDELAVLVVIGHYHANSMHGAARKWFSSEFGVFSNGSWRDRMHLALLDM